MAPANCPAARRHRRAPDPVTAGPSHRRPRRFPARPPATRQTIKATQRPRAAPSGARPADIRTGDRGSGPAAIVAAAFPIDHPLPGRPSRPHSRPEPPRRPPTPAGTRPGERGPGHPLFPLPRSLRVRPAPGRPTKPTTRPTARPTTKPPSRLERPSPRTATGGSRSPRPAGPAATGPRCPLLPVDQPAAPPGQVRVADSSRTARPPMGAGSIQHFLTRLGAPVRRYISVAWPRRPPHVRNWVRRVFQWSDRTGRANIGACTITGTSGADPTQTARAGHVTPIPTDPISPPPMCPPSRCAGGCANPRT
ncbi:hypothetical protein EKD16_01365 [Streptomonospora litoralis]|uniref:Uncharacterized protein n=1 Tax=Streptomonospora litoralis TaxID=2498135 RepID=A0A4P6PWR3_9ACTN|nr:hypothetical protein EKD16_01365 [Streptomonospora litoralis]